MTQTTKAKQVVPATRKVIARVKPSEEVKGVQKASVIFARTDAFYGDKHTRSAVTIASLLVLQGVKAVAALKVRKAMPMSVFRAINGATALNYWKNKDWLAGNANTVALTASGLQKVQARVSGDDGAYSVTDKEVAKQYAILCTGKGAPTKALPL